jgi:Putative  PD-(D/E)XK family member, (DUF4420)
MVPPNKHNDLLSAWRALAGNPTSEGWRTIRIAHNGTCALRAGRRFPGNEEALLAGFPSTVRIPSTEQLPSGRGFFVSKVDLGEQDAKLNWVALCRKSSGNFDLFAMMGVDIISTLESLPAILDELIFQTFLTRIKAWQEFMRQEGTGVLNPEAEVGLFGELEFLSDLIATGLPVNIAVDAWQGSIGGIQDYVFGLGAVEVKSTLAMNRFPVMIGSLDQLDDTRMPSLFLAGYKLSLDPTGRTLPEQINKLRELLQDNPLTKSNFESRLIQAGFLDMASDRYTRSFFKMENRLLQVHDSFPRLTRENVSVEITKVSYEIDLNLVSTGDIILKDALKALEVNCLWS